MSRPLSPRAGGAPSQYIVTSEREGPATCPMSPSQAPQGGWEGGQGSPPEKNCWVREQVNFTSDCLCCFLLPRLKHKDSQRGTAGPRKRHVSFCFKMCQEPGTRRPASAGSDSGALLITGFSSNTVLFRLKITNKRDVNMHLASVLSSLCFTGQKQEG